jgi:hypothetical protein
MTDLTPQQLALANSIERARYNFDPRKIDEHYFALVPGSREGALLETRSAIEPIPWSSALAPVASPLSYAPQAESPLPSCDAVIVSWTVAEALSASHVLTPGWESTPTHKGARGNYWYSYKSNWDTFLPLLGKAAPALEENCLGYYLPCTINNKRVLAMKSNLHLARDGAQLPMIPWWKQVIAETGAKLIITTGTAGGIGPEVVLGDVLVAESCQFKTTHTYNVELPQEQSFPCTASLPNWNAILPNSNVRPEDLMEANATQLPSNPHNYPVCIIDKDDDSSIMQGPAVNITMDYFGFDNVENTYGLKGLGLTEEMGDCILGLVCSQLSNPPAWVSVRNVSDPQMGPGTIEEEIKSAGSIYAKYGGITSIGSCIVSALIAAGV